MNENQRRYERKKELSRLRAVEFRKLKRESLVEQSRQLNCTSGSLVELEELSTTFFQNEARLKGPSDIIIDKNILMTLGTEMGETESMEKSNEGNVLPEYCSDGNELSDLSINALSHDESSARGSSDEETNSTNQNDNSDLHIREASMDEDEFEECSDDQEFNEIEELRHWALNPYPPIAHSRLDLLLLILRKRLLPNLPKCSKTFLKTQDAKYDIKTFDETDDSEFVYFGMEDHLKRIINPRLHKNDIIHLIINVDGLQLFKSSARQFWPILCKIHLDDINIYESFPVAIYSGKTKPKRLEKFLEDFINEINRLQQNGVLIGNQLFRVCIKAFICDTPARAFLKNIKNHGGYWSCERCVVKGEREEGRTVYLENAELRTDDSFRQQSNAQHHKGQSPLLNIDPPIDMVKTFVLDFMHLLCLGVMKKLMEYWLHGKLSTVKLGQCGKDQLSGMMVKLQNQIPTEFQRSTRNLSEFDKFKAVEFQFLLLYVGPIVFKKVLGKSVYQHFLLLHAACRILCSQKLATSTYGKAGILLKKFVVLCASLYSKSSLIGNIHNLLHLADDVENMNCCLSRLTAFPFENCLGKIKKLLRSGNRPLAQISRRLYEICMIQKNKINLPASVQILRKLKPDISGKIVIKRLKYKSVILTSKTPDNTVLLDNGTLLQIHNIYLPQSTSDDIQINGFTLNILRPMYDSPCDSSIFQMWEVTRRQSRSVTCRLTSVMNKMVFIDISEENKEKLFSISLLHM